MKDLRKASQSLLKTCFLKQTFPRNPHIKGCPKTSANDYDCYISALLEAYYLLENNVTVYIICCLNTSHHAEKQDWKGHVLTPSYLLLLDQGKQSLPFLIWAAELSGSCCLLWKTKEGINPPSSRKGSSSDPRWPLATWMFSPVIPVLSAVSQCPQWSETVLEQPKAGGFPCNVPMCFCGKRSLSVRGQCVVDRNLLFLGLLLQP